MWHHMTGDSSHKSKTNLGIVTAFCFIKCQLSSVTGSPICIIECTLKVC